jgi:hypothetical protein
LPTLDEPELVSPLLNRTKLIGNGLTLRELYTGPSEVPLKESRQKFLSQTLLRPQKLQQKQK